MQSDGDCEILHVLRIRMVNENSHSRYERWQPFNDLCGASRIDIPRAARVKIETDGVCAEQCSVARVFEFSDAADFDTRHDRPRIAATGSGDVRKCSPIKKASAPADKSKSTSALL